MKEQLNYKELCAALYKGHKDAEPHLIMPKLLEAELKRQVGDYLMYGTNQGRWYADRLNSGEVIVIAGQSRRRVKLCREGTADFFVLTKRVSIKGRDPMVGKDNLCRFGGIPVYTPRIIFIELKGEKGKQRPEQWAFQKLVENQGASYYIIRSIEELENILEVKNG